VSRLLKWLLSYSICATNLGLSNAARVLLLARVSAKTRSIAIPGVPEKFHFRGCADRGVMSHFFTESCYVQDTESRPVRSIVDCGANIGDETVKFWLRYPLATIVAIEPDPLNFSFLQRNTASLNRVVAKHAGVWHRDVRLRVVAGDTHEAFSVREDPAPGDKARQDSVRAVTIAGLIEEQGWPAIDILKIDIEGADLDLFANSSRWIDRVNVIIVEVNDAQRRGSTAALFAATSADDFDVFIHGENHVLIRRGLGWTLAPRFRLT
jgi:FkbM family methyltransferase